MSYRNKTYVIFDGDKDMWAYAYMKGWNTHQHMDFSFFDAHDIRPLTDRATEETVRTRLRERLVNTKQALVLVGESTQHLFRFVRWELEMCLKLNVPMVVVNLNGNRRMDQIRCPPILKGEYVAHVDFKMTIIKYALDQFPAEYSNRQSNSGGDRFYNESVYQKLGL